MIQGLLIKGGNSQKWYKLREKSTRAILVTQAVNALGYSVLASLWVGCTDWACMVLVCVLRWVWSDLGLVVWHNLGPLFLRKQAACDSQVMLVSVSSRIRADGCDLKSNLTMIMPEELQCMWCEHSDLWVDLNCEGSNDLNWDCSEHSWSKLVKFWSRSTCDLNLVLINV